MKKIFIITLALTLLVLPGTAFAACECVCTFSGCPEGEELGTAETSATSQTDCQSQCDGYNDGVCSTATGICRDAGTLPGGETESTTTGGGSDLRFEPPLGTTSVQEIIGNVIQAILGIVGSIALLMFVIGGFAWMTAAGNPERVKLGKNIIIWSVIGLAVIFAAYAITRFVITALLQ